MDIKELNDGKVKLGLSGLRPVRDPADTQVIQLNKKNLIGFLVAAGFGDYQGDEPIMIDSSLSPLGPVYSQGILY